MSKKVTPKSLRKHADWLEARGMRDAARKMRGWAYTVESGREFWIKWQDIPAGVRFVPSQFPNDLWVGGTTPNSVFSASACAIRSSATSSLMLDAQGPFVKAADDGE